MNGKGEGERRKRGKRKRTEHSRGSSPALLFACRFFTSTLTLSTRLLAMSNYFPHTIHLFFLLHYFFLCLLSLDRTIFSSTLYIPLHPYVTACLHSTLPTSPEGIPTWGGYRPFRSHPMPVMYLCCISAIHLLSTSPLCLSHNLLGRVG
jgi:hypothetical protein